MRCRLFLRGGQARGVLVTCGVTCLSGRHCFCDCSGKGLDAFSRGERVLKVLGKG